MSKLIILTIGVCLFVSCEKSDDVVAVSIDDDLRSYFDSFAAEGAARGIQVDYQSAQVEGVIQDIDENISGQCQHNADGPDRVVVDRDYWDQIAHMQREFIIFHELGHCFLDRSHLDDRDGNGICVSIMHSSSSTCRNMYNSTTRSGYLDELFSE
ncbi:MAG: hypothetical protein HKN87_19745 [Saprospiraceae bacterium]|nr:hypothetical protein [Saprospiraceae bacterium]